MPHLPQHEADFEEYVSETKRAIELQERLAAIVEGSEDAIVSKSLEGTIQSWNRAAERMFGYTAEEAIGSHISMIAPPDRVHEIPLILERIARGERIEHHETRRRTKDGRILTVALTISPVRDASGKIIGASKIARDITQQHRAMELQERLAAIVESSDDAIISKNLEGIIQSWNRGAERIFGYTANEMIGKHISTIASPDRVSEIPQILARIARGERIEHYQTKRRTKDGRILTMSLTVSPIRDAHGTIIGASKIARDITESERRTHLLEAANAALMRSNRDLEQFAYSASHDLREPLRMVSTYGGMLKRKFAGQLGESADTYISYIIEGAHRMQTLMDDLLAYTRVSTLDEAEPDEIDADACLDACLKSLDAMIKETGASVTRGALPRVRVHRFQLEQLFQNLIGNAIRYRSEEPLRIHVAAEKSGDRWLFSVQDNGIGIDPQYQEQIFGIFKRLHSSADYPGTGMGLAICQRIIERTGGRIWVESKPGKGSTFFFTIPA